LNSSALLLLGILAPSSLIDGAAYAGPVVQVGIVLAAAPGFYPTNTRQDFL
jgi:hypothetical protein